MRKKLFKIRRLFIIKPLRFSRENFGERSVTFSIALLIGFIAAIAAGLLHEAVTYLEKFALWLDCTAPSLYSDKLAWLSVLLFVPFLGLAASYAFQRYVGGARYAKSLSPLVLNLIRRRTGIPPREMFTHIISSALSVGAGGSAGLEAPSVLTGAAIGANGASFFNVDKKQRNLLNGCGAAADISAIFNTPIGGVLFAIEVLLPRFSVSSLIPMLMSSAVATVTSKMIFHSETTMLAITTPWKTNAVPFYFICGILSAFVGVYIIRTACRIGEWLKNKFPKPWIRLGVGGTILCILLTLFPSLRGQGYLFISELFSGKTDLLMKSSPLASLDIPPAILLVLLLSAGIWLKVVTSAFTVDSGGDGGIFAPSMFTGAFFGFAFARLINLTGIVDLQEHNFVVLGMCGVFTAVMRAPLTGIFLIADVTGGYTLLVPLMIVSAVSWFIGGRFEPHSIYHRALIANKLMSPDSDLAVLHQMPVKNCIEKDFIPLTVDMSLSEVNNLIEEQNTPHDIFPVLDANNRLQGIIQLEKIVSVMLDKNLGNTLLVYDIMEHVNFSVAVDDDLAWVTDNFDRHGGKHLPVCAQDGTFEGFVSKNTIFTLYRKLSKNSDEF